MKSSVPGSSNAHLSVRFADEDIVHFPSPQPPSPQQPQRAPTSTRDRSKSLIVSGSSGVASFSGLPRRGRVISKSELLHHLALSDTDSNAETAAVDSNDSNDDSAGIIRTSNASNQGGGFRMVEQNSQQPQQPLVMVPKYQPTNNIPPQVDPRGGRVARMATDNVREAAAAAVVAATAAAAAAAAAAASGIDKPNVVGKPTTAAVSTLRRRNAASERVRNKQASVCAILLVFLMLILPVTMVVGTVTHLSSGCRIWLDSPILLLVIGLCAALIAVMAPLFLFRLMGVRCLEDLLSICTIVAITLALGAIIFALLLVITGAMLFHPERPDQLQLCSLFIKKFITASVAVLWFFIAVLLLLFCCDVIMS